MDKRLRRRVNIKTETPIEVPRKWKDKEMEMLLNCMMKFGHKNLEKIHEFIPERSLENIKTFIRTVHDTAGKFEKPNDSLDVWINQCTKPEETGTPWRDCIQIAQVLKYLSVDGLLENHPVPERCQGIDFSQAYRLVYQIVMGYPLQPVNKPTADFVIETLAELNGDIIKQTDIIKTVQTFLNSESVKETLNPVAKESKMAGNEKTSSPKKAIKVYQRKKPISSNSIEVKPSLKIFVQEVPNSGYSDSGNSKEFCVAVEGHLSNVTTTVNVPVPYKKVVDQNETELLKSTSYNPFKIPEKWLTEPMHLNLRPL